MLTTALTLALSAAPVLGEAGESCRADADCLPSLACIASTCTERRFIEAPVSRQAAPVEQAQVVELAVVDEPTGPFTGIHFVLGARAGAGVLVTQISQVLYGEVATFSAVGLQAPAELRIGAHFGRFELMAEVAPQTVAVARYQVRTQFSAALSAGWFIGLHENGDFSVSLPVRVRGGLFLTSTTGGGLVGGSAGIALRWGRAILEFSAGGEYRDLVAGFNAAVPVQVGFSWVF